MEQQRWGPEWQQRFRAAWEKMSDARKRLNEVGHDPEARRLIWEDLGEAEAELKTIMEALFRPE